MVSKSKVGLALGLFFALVHAVWAVLVALTPSGMQKFIDWVMGLHFIGMTMAVQPFNLTSAIILVVITFVFGYIFGWVFTAFLNLTLKTE